MMVSLRAGYWPHAWLDAAALAALMPPLAWLYLHDRRPATAPAPPTLPLPTRSLP